MSSHFSNHFIRNGLVVDFHGLDVSGQHQAPERNAQLSMLLHALQGYRHSHFTLSVHPAFSERQLQCTILYCCGGRRREAALALLASTCPAFCRCTGSGQRRKVRVSA